MKVADIMTDHVETLDPDDDIDLASMIMRLDRLRHLPVVEDGRLVGLISDRDILRAQQSTLAGATKEEVRRFNMRIKARDVMTQKVETTTPEASALEAAEILRERGYGCLPVMRDGMVVGIVTPTDFLGLVVQLLLR
jgi:CBS domain-containing membrane protein